MPRGLLTPEEQRELDRTFEQRRSAYDRELQKEVQLLKKFFRRLANRARHATKRKAQG